jgi:hypothetical protein
MRDPKFSPQSQANPRPGRYADWFNVAPHLSLACPIDRCFYLPKNFKTGLGISVPAHGPVAQGIEQQPSKLKVAGSNPAGVAIKINDLRH